MTIMKTKGEPQTTAEFDATNFLLVPVRQFEDLKIGDVFRAPSRTLTDAHASAFQAVSADKYLLKIASR